MAVLTTFSERSEFREVNSERELPQTFAVKIDIERGGVFKDDKEKAFKQTLPTIAMFKNSISAEIAMF